MFINRFRVIVPDIWNCSGLNAFDSLNSLMIGVKLESILFAMSLIVILQAFDHFYYIFVKPLTCFFFKIRFMNSSCTSSGIHVLVFFYLFHLCG